VPLRENEGLPCVSTFAVRFRRADGKDHVCRAFLYKHIANIYARLIAFLPCVIEPAHGNLFFLTHPGQQKGNDYRPSTFPVRLWTTHSK
jgi:hypothetical protein